MKRLQLLGKHITHCIHPQYNHITCINYFEVNKASIPREVVLDIYLIQIVIIFFI